ncbi:MAG: nucleotidyltransferase domain-containing protein [Candidatus Freyarchaeota archaeon]
MGTGLTEEYFKILEENKDFFKKAFEIAEKISKKVEKLLGDCEVYVTGSFARGEHTHSPQT